MRQSHDRNDDLWTAGEMPQRSSGPVIATVSISAIVLIVLFILYAIWGVRAIRRTLIAESERNAVALLESILLASQYSITASGLTDQLEWENLATRARIAAARAPVPPLTDDELRELADLSDADGVTVWMRGNVRSYPPDLDTVVAEHPDLLGQQWDSMDREARSFEVYDTILGSTWRGAGISTSQGWGVAIWEYISAEMNTPSWSGIGVLIQEIGRRSDVNYIMLQSPDGIVFASRPLPPVLRLADDEFLVNSLDDTAAASREIVFEDTPVLEVVKPFLSADLPSGMFRVGISLEGVESAQQRLMMQLGLSAVLFLLLATASIAFLIARRSYGDLNRSYQRVETLTRRILDSIDQAVMAADSRGRITVFNRAAERLFGRARNTKSEPTIDSLIGEDSYRLRDVASGSEPVHEQEHKLKTGTRCRHLVFSTTPVVTGEGRLEGAVSIVRDETETRDMEEQMRRSQRLSEMGNLAAGVAHEIRNPLNAIGLAAQRLQMEVTDPDARKIAATVLDETRRLNAIVEDFLSLARPSAQPIEDINLSELVLSVASMARLEAEQKGVKWSETIAESVGIRGVSDDLRKALWNVITNAIAATPETGAVMVCLESTGTDAVISIRDEGSGIEPELIERVFQPYFTTKDHGTGLGLAITHRIVTDHQGTIRIESPPPEADIGTKVTITIPLSTHHEPV